MVFLVFLKGRDYLWEGTVRTWIIDSEEGILRAKGLRKISLLEYLLMIAASERSLSKDKCLKGWYWQMPWSHWLTTRIKVSDTLYLVPERFTRQNFCACGRWKHGAKTFCFWRGKWKNYAPQRKNSGATFGKNTDRNFSVLGSCFRMSGLRVLLQRGDGESLTRRVVSVLSERVIHEGL